MAKRKAPLVDEPIQLSREQELADRPEQWLIEFVIKHSTYSDNERIIEIRPVTMLVDNVDFYIIEDGDKCLYKFDKHTWEWDSQEGREKYDSAPQPQHNQYMQEKIQKEIDRLEHDIVQSRRTIDYMENILQEKRKYLK